MKIVEIKGSRALAEAEGVKREIGIELLKDVTLGEYVMVHAGYAIEKIDTAEAQETIKVFEEYKDALRKGFKK